MRRLAFSLGLATLAAALALFATVSPIHANPAVVIGPPTEGAKVTLADTSIDGPALWTSPTGATRAVIAWTGANQRLYYMTSGNGLSFGNKHTLNETSRFRPAIAAVSSDANPTVEIAWTGTDAAHRLNLLSGIPGQGYAKVTLRDTSFTAPSLAINGGTVYLAWAGEDANHSVNVVPILWRGGLSVGAKVTLRQFSSIARPSIAFDPNGSQLILTYISANGRINFATSTDGVHWATPATSPLAEWSDAGATMMGFPVNNMPRQFVAWRGIDPRHSLNIQYTEGFPRWPLEDSKATLKETALGGPALGYVGVYRQVIIAWTGTDAAHHLNVAVIKM